jgi:hypothetical protein
LDLDGIFILDHTSLHEDLYHLLLAFRIELRVSEGSGTILVEAREV